MNEWETESNLERWTYREHDCVVLRIENLGHLCGYASFHKEDISKIDTTEIHVHGGVTYESSGLHIVDPDSKKYWIGFDCAHYGDLVPSMSEKGLSVGHETYRNIEYVKNQTEQIVDSAIDMIKTNYKEY